MGTHILAAHIQSKENMMKSGILSVVEKKILTAYSATILALTAVGIVCISRLYKSGFSELFLPC